jgi:hypothetical protein
MAQISRPFQIVLVVFALFVPVWFVALRGHSSSSGSSPSAATPATAPPASTPAAKAAGHTGIYHGSAPGVEGLSRAIAKAHGAVAASQRNVKRQEAIAGSLAAPSSQQIDRAAKLLAKSVKPSAVPGVTKLQATPSSTKAQTAPARTPARQALVERALKQGKVAVILFWNPHGADDTADRLELKLLESVHHLIPPLARHSPSLRSLLKHSGLELEKKFAAFEAKADQVTSFGSITRGVQVYGTPTILIVNPHGQVITVTGLTDAFAIEQAIEEARHL